MKKVVMGLGIALVLIVSFLVLVFYLVFRPKYKDVSDVRPFVEIVGKKITTKRKALIIVYPGDPLDENYKYHLEDGTSFGLDSGLETIAEIPIGTEVLIEKVEMHTGRVSGTTSVYLFGKVYSIEKQKEFTFQYTWGEYHSLYQDKPFWTFDLAFWQNEAIADKFYIKVP